MINFWIIKLIRFFLLRLKYIELVKYRLFYVLNLCFGEFILIGYINFDVIL